VVGQADKQGDPATNERLAKQRAEAVAKILRDYGVPDRALDVRSRGEAFGGSSMFGLLSNNEDDRRVEVSYSK
jgi:outer membrane protein OmpA-like peptidoglycan-associated protein